TPRIGSAIVRLTVIGRSALAVVTYSTAAGPPGAVAHSSRPSRTSAGNDSPVSSAQVSPGIATMLTSTASASTRGRSRSASRSATLSCKPAANIRLTTSSAEPISWISPLTPGVLPARGSAGEFEPQRAFRQRYAPDHAAVVLGVAGDLDCLLEVDAWCRAAGHRPRSFTEDAGLGAIGATRSRRGAATRASAGSDRIGRTAAAADRAVSRALVLGQPATARQPAVRHRGSVEQRHL